MKNIYAIWKNVNDKNVVDVNDLIGYFHGTWEEADALVLKMNEEDITVTRGLFKRFQYGYWKEELREVTLNNFRESITFE